jgi:hypothetical protein
MSMRTTGSVPQRRRPIFHREELLYCLFGAVIWPAFTRSYNEDAAVILRDPPMRGN